MDAPEKANLQEWEVDEWLLRAGDGSEERLWMGPELLLKVTEMCYN